MNIDIKHILIVLEQYLEANPSIRFGQALYNLNINQPDINFSENHLLRDIYADSDDEILRRLKP